MPATRLTSFEQETYRNLRYWPKVFWIFAIGFLLGVFFAIVASVFHMADSRGIASRYGSLSNLWCVYVVGGSIGGLLAGLLLPFVRSRFGAIMVGVVGMLPFYVSGALHLIGPVRDWGSWITGGIVIAGLATGAGIGLKGWKEYGG